VSRQWVGCKGAVFVCRGHFIRTLFHTMFHTMIELCVMPCCSQFVYCCLVCRIGPVLSVSDTVSASARCSARSNLAAFASMLAYVANSFDREGEENAEPRFNGIVIAPPGGNINRRNNCHQVFDDFQRQCVLVGGNGANSSFAIYLHHMVGCAGRHCRCLELAASVNREGIFPQSLTTEIVNGYKAVLGSYFHIVVSTASGVSSFCSNGEREVYDWMGHGNFSIL
jgi:hypothetical protein